MRIALLGRRGIRKYGKYLFYLLISVTIVSLVYGLSIFSFRKVENLVSNRLEVHRIYEKWLILKSDAFSFLKSDKQENIHAKLGQSLDLFERDFLFFSRKEFLKLREESPEIFVNSVWLIEAWQSARSGIREILETGSDFESFSSQIYWLANDTVIFEDYLGELLKWFDSYNSRQLLFHWRSFYFLAVMIILSSLFAARQARNYVREKAARQETLDLMYSIVSEREKERLKLALDIHDTIIQDLSFSRMLCRDLGDSLLRKETQKKLDELTAVIARTTGQIREITYDLMPPEIGQKDIGKIVIEYCGNFSRKTGIKTEANVSGFSNVVMGDAQRFAIYRIIQECLTNVRKHSCATAASVKLLLTYPFIVLKIEDNGIGSSCLPDSERREHHIHIGLTGIQERARMFDGEVNIKSIPGKGFAVTIRMKLSDWKETA